MAGNQVPWVSRAICGCAGKQGQLRGRVKIRVDVRSALSLAKVTPRPEACTTGIMKCVASYEYVTLEQLRMIFGLTAQRALRE